MATVAAQPPRQEFPKSLSLDGLLTIAGAVILLLAIVYFNNDLSFRLDSKIDNVRTELKADIADVRTELKADIADVRAELKADIADVRLELDAVRLELKADIDGVGASLDAARSVLEADIQRVDDRIFAIGYPAPPDEEAPQAAD